MMPHEHVQGERQMTTEETYLGDAVFASFDGYQVWLRTSDGNNNQIALEPPVLAALFAYVDDIKRVYAERNPPPEDEVSP
jgi:hypothetical protein